MKIENIFEAGNFIYLHQNQMYNKLKAKFILRFSAL